MPFSKASKRNHSSLYHHLHLHKHTATQSSLSMIMGNSKFLKLAVSGVAIGAIAIGIGVGVGVHNKKIKDAASTSAGRYEDCRRLLLVPGIDIESNVADAPSTRRKLLARRLGNVIESYENTEVWQGDTYYTPSASITPSTSKGLKGTHSPYGLTSTAGTKPPKGSKSTFGITDSSKGTKGPKGVKSTSDLVGSTKSKGPKGSKSTSGLTDLKSPKGPKGSKSTTLPVRVIGYMFCIQHLFRRSCLSDSFPMLHT